MHPIRFFTSLDLAPVGTSLGWVRHIPARCSNVPIPVHVPLQKLTAGSDPMITAVHTLRNYGVICNAPRVLILENKRL